MIHVFPGRGDRMRPIQNDERRHKDRWRVEATFCGLKDFFRIAAHYDKCLKNQLAAAKLIRSRI